MKIHKRSGTINIVERVVFDNSTQFQLRDGARIITRHESLRAALKDMKERYVLNTNPEYEKARLWREALNLTPAELGELLGYSVESILWFEKGMTPPRGNSDRAIKPWIWQRYKLCCAGLDAQRRSDQHGMDYQVWENNKFEWDT